MLKQPKILKIPLCVKILTKDQQCYIVYTPALFKVQVLLTEYGTMTNQLKTFFHISCLIQLGYKQICKGEKCKN